MKDIEIQYLVDNHIPVWYTVTPGAEDKIYIQGRRVTDPTRLISHNGTVMAIDMAGKDYQVMAESALVVLADIDEHAQPKGAMDERALRRRFDDLLDLLNRIKNYEA